MSAPASDWSDFHRRALLRPPRELLRRTAASFACEQRTPGIAIDLGCGSGAETAELLRAGWEVHAVDADTGGLEMLVQALPVESRGRLHVHAAKMEDFEFPTCDLLWAGYSLPYCERARWPDLWQRATAALAEGGRIAGDFFGPAHAFAQEFVILTLTQAEARAALQSLSIEAFDIEDGYRPSGGTLTRWQAWGFAARRGAYVPAIDAERQA